MTDPIAASIGAGIAGNIATMLVQQGAKLLQHTPAGSILSAAGVINPTFEDRLRHAAANAAEVFLIENPQYNNDGVTQFLRDRKFGEALGTMLIDGEPLDIPEVSHQLYNYMNLPLSHTPINLRTENMCGIIIDSYVHALNIALAEEADEGVLWLSSNISAIRSIISRVSDEISEVRQVMPGLFGQALSERQSLAEDKFEATYLEHVCRRFGRLTTPGARELHGVNQNLNIAYISLNLKAHGYSEPARAEQFLIENPMLVIRGPAGSGKTTLLHWVTVKCAQEDPVSPWSGGVPFFVPLRTVARTDNGIPVVGKFVEYSTDTQVWTADTPPQWVHSVLKDQRRGIVMIDGVDELPSSDRPSFWSWLSSFIEEYPGNRVIITSRTLPGIVSQEGTNRTEQWNPPSSFIDSSLEEMSNEDITLFVQHWHDAVDRDKIDEAETHSLSKARDSLPIKLLDPGNIRIRELCSSPLLCAMVCVLHWREEGYLPKRRVDLYDKCCEMLVEARDLKREIPAPSGLLALMTKNDKEMILQRLAFDMMIAKPDGDEEGGSSYRVEITRDKAIDLIGPKINSFQNSNARSALAADILDFLIERTGLLREPVTGLIDFPHRTFQEYLAACAAGADSQYDFLAKQADDDQWHETIMLAAGTSTGGVSFGRNLIDALLRRAERHRSLKPKSQRVRRTCFALALGCLENLRQQEPALRDRVLSTLSELVPPHDEAGARSLSVAGDAVIPYLHYEKWKDERTSTVAACAQALRQIGTATALSALADGYVTDAREQVIAELCKTNAIPFRDIPLVVQRVQNEGELPRFVEISDLSILEGLNNLKSVSINAPEPKNIDLIGTFSELRGILISSIPLNRLRDIMWPEAVEVLTLVGNPGNDLSWIQRFRSLKSVVFAFMDDIKVLDVGAGIDHLESLSLMGLPLVDIGPIKSSTHLKRLTLEKMALLNDISVLGNFPLLEALRISDCNKLSDLTPLESLSSLEKVQLNSLSVRKWPSFQNLKQLKDVEITSIALPFDGGCLEGAERVEKLSLRNCARITGVSKFVGLKSLVNLEISNCGIRDFPELEYFPRLEEIKLRALRGVSVFTALKNCNPKKLILERFLGWEGMGVLAEMQELMDLQLRSFPTLRVRLRMPNRERCV